MADIQSIKAAMMAADAAGDIEGAKVLAGALQRQLLAQQASAIPPATNSLRDYAAAAGTGVVDGLTLGFGDEIVSAVQAPFSDRTYGEILSERDAKTKELAAQYPITSVIGGLAGGAVTGGIGAAKALGSQAVRALPTLARGAVSAGVGTTEGAIAGAGYASPGDRMEGATTGAIFGGALGAAIPAAVHTFKPVIDRVRSLTSEGGARNVGMEAIERFARRDGIAPKDLPARLSQAGADAMPTDLGRNLEALGEYVSQRPGAGMRLALERIGARNEGQAPRIVSTLRQAAGIADDAADIAVDPAAGKALRDTFGQRVQITPDETAFVELINRPSIQQAWSRATVLAREAGQEMPALKVARKALRDGDPVELSTEQLHWLKKGLDDILEPKRDPITGIVVSNTGRNMLEAQKSTRADFRNFIKAKNPAYAEALEGSASELRHRSAYDMGKEAVRRQSGDVEQQIRNLQGRDLDAFRRGYVEAVEAAISKTADLGQDVTRKITDTRKLSAIFGPEKGKAISDVIARERDMWQSGGRMLGNSRTAFRQGLTQDMEGGSAVSDIVSSGASGGITGMASVLIKRAIQATIGERRVPDRAVEQVAKVLFESDPRVLEDLLRQTAAFRRTGALPGGVGGTPYVTGTMATQGNPGVSRNRR